jgi:hypothetical protein
VVPARVVRVKRRVLDLRPRAGRDRGRVRIQKNIEVGRTRRVRRTARSCDPGR